jgi:hypothetical protein
MAQHVRLSITIPVLIQAFSWRAEGGQLSQVGFDLLFEASLGERLEHALT